MRKSLGLSMQRARMLWSTKVDDAAKGCGLKPSELTAMEGGRARVTDTVINYYESAFRMDSDDARRLRDKGDEG